jgi:hypothetical protein
MSNETTQVIYSMNKVGRIVPPNKQILRDISLGFYYGAKTPTLAPHCVRCKCRRARTQRRVMNLGHTEIPHF